MFASAVRDLLIARGESLLAQPPMPILFTREAPADELLNNLRDYPHAFVFACLMDRQIKAEKAWLIPYLLREKLGHLDVRRLVDASEQEIISLVSGPPPLHRFPVAMGQNLYWAIQHIHSSYEDDASDIWNGKPSSATIVLRFLRFRGAGPKIATMAANILVRDFKVPVSDKYSIDISPDIHIRRTLTRLGMVHEGAKDEELIYTARALHPEYPGIFDLSLWELGRTKCHPESPLCVECDLRQYCPTAHV